MTKKQEAKFDPGDLWISRRAGASLALDDIHQALSRHLQGDWGIVTNADWQANDEALRQHGRLLSIYRTANGVRRFFVITEADRSSTTILLPEDY